MLVDSVSPPAVKRRLDYESDPGPSQPHVKIPTFTDENHRLLLLFDQHFVNNTNVGDGPIYKRITISHKIYN